jgi:spore coat polysaccharide biosynthesis predicted glycosyltransferase SpsG
VKKKFNILICPLEWGLGHAARMIPLARCLRDMDNNITIASGEEHLSLFRNELPGLSYINFTGFKPSYSRFLPQYLSLFFKIPVLLFHIIAEHQALNKIITKYDIDIIISDNRFGLWNKKITSVYITHMPLIPFPKPLKFLEPAGVFLHSKIIKKYSLCFIPDLPGELNLTGRLAHGIRLTDNVRYIGILSRFQIPDPGLTANPLRVHRNTVILSGPEPQREILKQKLVAILKDKEPHTIMFEGKPGKSGDTNSDGNITFYYHQPAPIMKEIIETSDNIISRSGYTTIMELVSLNSTALIIPTPGQTEQEYLAEYLSGKGWFCTQIQSKINAENLICPGRSVLHTEINRQSKILLTGAVNELLEKQHRESQSKETG